MRRDKFKKKKKKEVKRGKKGRALLVREHCLPVLRSGEVKVIT